MVQGFRACLPMPGLAATTEPVYSRVQAPQEKPELQLEKPVHCGEEPAGHNEDPVQPKYKNKEKADI